MADPQNRPRVSFQRANRIEGFNEEDGPPDVAPAPPQKAPRPPVSFQRANRIEGFNEDDGPAPPQPQRPAGPSMNDRAAASAAANRAAGQARLDAADASRAAATPTPPQTGGPTMMQRAAASATQNRAAGEARLREADKQRDELRGARGSANTPTAPTRPAAPARPAAPSRPASTPSGTRPQSGRRSAPYEGDADTRALNNISYDLAKGVQGPPAPGREAATRNIAGAMGFAKGGLVRHTPGWSFGKSNSSTGNGKYAKGKGK